MEVQFILNGKKTSAEWQMEQCCLTFFVKKDVTV